MATHTASSSSLGSTSPLARSGSLSATHFEPHNTAVPRATTHEHPRTLLSLEKHELVELCLQYGVHASIIESI